MDYGSISESPSKINKADAEESVNDAIFFLWLGKALCGIFRDVKNRPSLTLVNNLVLNLEEDLTSIQRDEA